MCSHADAWRSTILQRPWVVCEPDPNAQCHPHPNGNEHFIGDKHRNGDEHRNSDSNGHCDRHSYCDRHGRAADYDDRDWIDRRVLADRNTPDRRYWSAA